MWLATSEMSLSVVLLSQIVPCDHTVNTGYRGLPAPDMEYLTKRPVPFKWTPPHKYSAFMLEDNTAVFVGTRHCEEAIKKSFLDSLLLEEDGDSGSDLVTARGESESTKAECSSELLTRSEPSTSRSAVDADLHARDEPPQPPDQLTETVYDTSMDTELLRDPQVLKDFMDDSDFSSDDSDVPRVNVTGRYEKGEDISYRKSIQ